MTFLIYINTNIEVNAWFSGLINKYNLIHNIQNIQYTYAIRQSSIKNKTSATKTIKM